MAIGFGNGGNLLINTSTAWAASFQSIQPFTIQNATGDITAINVTGGTLRTQITSSRPAIQPQPASFFFDPELGEQPELTNGADIVDCLLSYPGSNLNRKGTLSISGYTDGGLIDDEVMVGELTMNWRGGVTLASITNVTGP